MKRTQWLWLAGSLATAVGCSDPPPTGNNPPPADVVSEKTPDATDNDVVGQDNPPPPDMTPPPPDGDMPDMMPPPPDGDMPDTMPPGDVTCSNAGEIVCNGTCVNVQMNNSNCGACGTACMGTQVCMSGMCVEPMMCPTGQNLCGMTCVNTQTDVANCGACGNLCPSGQTCSAGTCMAPMMCPTGQTSCGGTCVDTQADSNNCGTCGTACMMGQSCQMGMCRATTTCTAPQVACGGTCVNTQTDVANCGMCGVACPTGQACTAGVCAMMGCTAPQVLCGTACANTQTDTANCGMCGRACATGQMCTAGVCTGGVVCPMGQMMCGAACADLQTDPTNCGMCGMACPAGNTCAMGRCVAPRPTCMMGETDCAPMAPTPTCVNTQTSNANCGACGVACPTGQTCQMGACTCGTGQTLCGRTCVNTMTDRANCGACGRACPMGQSCTGAMCVCPTGQTLCGGACVNAQTDNSNCGMCGRVCPMGQTCTAGACACPMGQMACGTPPMCINTMTDRANCGMCGRACTVMGQTCTGGMCACPTGQMACGTGAAAACVDLQTSGANCGMCGRTCAAGTACTRGVCMGTPPANDTRMGATVINLAMPSQTLSANTTAARNDTTSCACTSGNDVFYRFTLTQPEVVYVDTFGATWDTSLFFQNAVAQNGQAINSNVTQTAPNVTCNDDNAAAGFCPGLGTGLQSQVAARLPAGQYYLVLSGCGSGTADIHFQHLAAGAGTVNTRLTPSATEQTVAGATAGTGAVSNSCCSGGPDNTLWWITCPNTAAQTFFASTCNATTGVNLANYDVEIAQNSALRATGAVCNDDTGFVCGTGSSMTSSIPATTATIGGLNTLIPDSCSTAGGNYTIRYVLAAPCATGARCGATCVDTNTNVNNCGGCDRRCAAGNLCIAGACIAPPANDTPAGARVIDMTVPQTLITGIDTRAAVNNTAGSCGCTSGNDIFFNFTIPAGPRQIIYADTLGSNWDTSLFVQTSTGTNVTVAGLTTGVACNDDGGLAGCGTGLQSQIMLLLNPGAYRLVLSGCGTGGTTTNLRFHHLVVGNGTVTALAAGNTTPTGTTSGTSAITQSCGGGTGPENTYFWHTCAAQAAGSLTASTCARATWDTVLEQRSAARAAAVCNDDVGGTCGFRSSVTAAIPAGPGLHTLYIDGFSGGAGAYSIAVTRP
jgi:hypothetical protein